MGAPKETIKTKGNSKIYYKKIQGVALMTKEEKKKNEEEKN